MAIRHILLTPHAFTKTFTHHWNPWVNTQHISPRSTAVLFIGLEKNQKMLYLLTAQIQVEGNDTNMEAG